MKKNAFKKINQVGQLAYSILLSWGQRPMLVHKRAPKYFCAQDKFTKYNGTSLCIHLLRQFYASHLYNAWQEDAKYGNILSSTEWSLTTKGTIYCITFALFIFIFLSSCSVALSSPWASSRTVVKQHFTLPSDSWCIDPNTLLLHLARWRPFRDWRCSGDAASWGF